MANTQVFTLGLGVTVINPLGLAIEQLRRDVERLRRQADGTRLGRLIGEVIRLGSELDKLRQVERQLALDQEQQHEVQIARVGDEAEAVERLRQHYQMLDRVIAGLARLQPFKAGLELKTFRTSNSVTTEQHSTAANQQPDAGVPAKAASPEFKVSLARGALVAAGLGLTALVGRRVGRSVVQRQPRNTQRRIARVAGKEWQAHRVDAIGKLGKALVEGETGEEKAQGAGAAVGEIGGRVLGSVLTRLTTSRMARQHGGKAGAYLGEVFGKLVAGKLYGWVAQDASAHSEAEATPGGTTASGAGQPDAPAQVSPQRALTRGAAAAAVLGLTALAGRRVARAIVRRQPHNTQRRIARVAGKDWQARRVDALGKVGKALVEGATGEEKAQGVGAALGEVGGRVLGGVLPKLTKSRFARKHGAAGGAYLGEALGQMAGGGLFNWATQPVNPQPRSTPAATKQGDAVTAPSSIGQMPETALLEAQGLSSLLPEGAGTLLPGIGKLLKKVPGAALLDASVQMVDTYNSAGTSAQKLEGYSSAAGGLGGTLAGAAAGAAIGSVVPVIGTAIGGLIGGVLGGMGGESAGGWLGHTVAAITGNDEPGSNREAASQPAPPPSVSAHPSQAVTTPTFDQQFTFTANMPVTFNNSFDDPTTLQQLEAIARRVLDDLMRQARSVQMADQPQP
ncbi:hypothetical protein [Pseudomonas sp. NBRC 111124]|uniref:hypothetical protein n=1 Tax=Pseudomonas sp. NBRC 111124 TaxID=1661039 RepID=UPI000762088E|nr:hypothetical protein [Pseudomonas sp. NBRC 111124]